MPGPYPPSNFAAAVGSFLDSYALVSGIKSQRRMDRMAMQRAESEKAVRQADLYDRGYTEQKMPEILRPPATSWEQSVGRFLKDRLGGGPEEPGTFLTKTHPSVRETEIAGARQAHVADVAEEERYGLMLEGVKAADARKLEADRNAGDTERTRMSNATSLRVAGMNREPTAMQARDDREAQTVAGVERAIQAANGNAQVAHQLYHAANRGQNVPAEYFMAAAQRFTERKAVLAEADRQSREGIAATRRGSGSAFEEDLRERLRAANATTSGGDQYATQRADWDRAAAAVRAQKGDPEQVLGPRPPAAR